MEMIRWVFVALVVLYAAFIVVTRFKRKRERRGYLHLHEKLITYPVLLVGYPLDVVVNLTVASVLFLDPPAELTVSDRLTRYLHDDATDWRYAVARWLDDRIIDPVDRGHLR